MNNPNEKRLNELKLLYIDFLEMDQISKQFNNYIQRIKNLDQIIFGNISETFRSTNQTDNLIPIPCSIKQVANKIRKTPLDQWPMINPSLQCYRLDKQPLLLMNCNYINTNECIVKLIEQILPVMIDIDKDIDRVHYALQLIMPKLRDGEYVAIDLLEQLMDKIESFQCEIQTAYEWLMSYNERRANRIVNYIRHIHNGDERIILNRFDQDCLIMFHKIIDDLYRWSILIYRLFTINHEQLMEYKNIHGGMTIIDKERFENFYQ
ncbi:Proteasome activator complex subunit 3 [Dermatophagoides farinae]|uniref:Proteasome activator complex subunit 3 n=1 Tax=Dermatophagoides farinae TaxID=6954 RepID=A0A922I5W3_DERFA|nr:Proteasome activator complex subunit 3 [Dermatophagoides farinae]